MANALYGLGRQKFLEGSIAWLTGDIKACLVDTGVYTVAIDTHDFLDDVTGIIATSPNFAGKTSTLGVADANDIVFSAVTGATCEAIIIYRDSGVAATSELIAYIDTATGLPVTPNGGDINVAWDGGANRIFKL